MDIFFSAILTSLILVGFGIYWQRFPPKKINYFYGYRTRRSMANQEIWNYSNALGALMFIYLGALSLLGTLVFYMVVPEWSVFTNIFLVLVGLAIGMFWCETQISKKFDRNGKPKK